jgi:hypothetical protein
MYLSYIDAGTGSMALQIVLAGVLSIGYAMHARWDALKKLLARRSKKG